MPSGTPSAQTKAQAARDNANTEIVTKQGQLEQLTQELADLRAKVPTLDNELEQRTREVNEAEAAKNAVVGPPMQTRFASNNVVAPQGAASSTDATVANDSGVALQTVFTALQGANRDALNMHTHGDPEQLRGLLVVCQRILADTKAIESGQQASYANATPILPKPPEDDEADKGGLEKAVAEWLEETEGLD